MLHAAKLLRARLARLFSREAELSSSRSVAVAAPVSFDIDLDAPHTELNIRSDPANLAAVRKAVEGFALRNGLNTQSADALGLCVNEAMANVIRHAYGNDYDRPVVLSLSRTERGVAVSLRDWGNGVNPVAVAKDKTDLLTPGGLGMICLKRLMDDVRFEPQTDGMLLTLVKDRDGKSASPTDCPQMG